MYAQWPFHIADCQSNHAPAQWDAMKIPLELLEQPRPIRPSGILALPTELLLQILMHVEPVSQLFLALTCKRLLVVCTMTVILIPSASKHRAQCLDCSAMVSILHTLRPLDARGRTKRSWALCCVCYRYRPKRRTYWKGVPKHYPNESFGKILGGYEWIVESWCEKDSSSYQCPDCWCKERVDKYGHLVSKKDLN